MWKKTYGLVMCGVFALALSFCSFSGSCLAAETTPYYQITEAELQELSTHLDALEQNYNILMTAYQESNEDLTEALTALKLSRQELTTLRRELETYKTEVREAKQHLETANAELQLAVQSLKESEADKAKTEKSLKKQLTIWKILFGVAIGAAGAGFILG